MKNNKNFPKKAKTVNRTIKAKKLHVKHQPKPVQSDPYAEYLWKMLWQMEQEEKATREADMAKVQNGEVLNFLPKEEKHEVVEMTDEEKKEQAKKELLWETNRRHLANKAIAKMIVNSAKESAMVFVEAEAEQLLGGDYRLMGCKKIFQHMEILNLAIDTAKDATDAAFKAYSDAKFEGVDLDALSEYRKAYHNARRIEEEVVRERKVITKALKKAKEEADPVELAIITARAQAVANKFGYRKPLPEGARTIEREEKPILKGFKMMAFLPKDLRDPQLVRALAALNATYVDGDCWQAMSDDERDEAIEKTQIALKKVIDILKNRLVNRIPFRAKAENAKINNARQSELTDAVGVPYGNTTDMMVSISHDVQAMFNKGLIKQMGCSREQAEKKLKEVCVLFANILTECGMEIELLSGRIQKYVFWNANNSQLKVGKAYVLSERAYAKAEEIGQCAMELAEYLKIPANGSEYLKWWSYATTPGAPMTTKTGDPVYISDVLVMKEVDIVRNFKYVYVIDKNGEATVMKTTKLARNGFDGMFIAIVPITSQQARGGFAFKGFVVNCAYDDGTNMIDEIAAREGWEVPELVPNSDGEMVDWRKYKLITNESTFKWAKYGLKYSEYVKRMNKLAEKYPGVNQMYTARSADATEEANKRHLARQCTQMFLNMGQEQIDLMVKGDVKKLKKLCSLPGVIRKMAGLDKPESQRTAFEHLIEIAPEYLTSPEMTRKVHDMFHNSVAEAAVRPSVNGIYPYIAEDPAAFIKIYIFGKNPDEVGLGYLKENEINVPEEEEGRKLFFIRYPANAIVGMVRINHNDPIYRCVGNVAILSIDGDTLIRADGDVDGDEACIVRDELIVDLMEQVLEWINVPMVSFPHEKAAKFVYNSKEEKNRAIAEAIVTANIYGGEVGKNSNLATKLMNAAAVAAFNEKASVEDRRKGRQKYLIHAIYAHVGAIQAIDLAKTGFMPVWLSKKLAAANKVVGQMPWNQRFCKHNVATPWYDTAWDEMTEKETSSPCDRIARTVVDKSNAENYTFNHDGVEFNVEDHVSPMKGLNRECSKGTIDKRTFYAIEARNYREGEKGEFQLITNAKLPEKDQKPTSPTELMMFVWRNRAAMMYKVVDGRKVNNNLGGSNIGNAEMMVGYYSWVHDLMIDFGKNGTNSQFTKLSDEMRHLSMVNKMLRLAFGQNGIDATALEKATLTAEEVKEIVASKRASFADFTLKVFAWELYQIECDRKGIPEYMRWTKTAETPEDDDEAHSYDPSCNEDIF